MDKDLQLILNAMVDLAKSYPAAMYTYPKGDDTEISSLMVGPVYRLEDEIIFHGSMLGQAMMLAFPYASTRVRLNAFDIAKWPPTWWSVVVEYLGREIPTDVGSALNKVQDEHDQGETWSYCIKPLLQFVPR